MPASDLNGLIDAIEEGNVSASQLERLSTALRSTLNRRIHSTNLVKLNRGHWLNVDRMETESDGRNAYLRLTLKIVIGKG